MAGAGGKKRLTIGLSIDDILMVGGQKALRGASDVAREAGVDLYCFHKDFCKGDLNVPASWEAINQILDGLVIYQPWPNEETFRSFRARFPSVPAVNGARLYPGCPAMTPDSYQGLKDMLAHLHDVHGYRRVALLSGPEGNWSANERHRGFVDFHAERKIPLSPDLITPRLGWAEGNRGILVLLEEKRLKPGKDFDAIIGANDTIAMGALDELRAHGIGVPDDVALVGFDDDARTLFSSPPISTVGYDMGRHAAKTLLSLLAGEKVPDRTFVPTTMVIRRSCGCLSSAVSEAEAPIERPVKPRPFAATLKDARAAILEDMRAGFGSDAGAWMGSLLDAFAEDISSAPAADRHAFLSTLEKTMYLARSAGHDAILWRSPLSAMRKRSAPLLDDSTLRRAENLWQQARMVVEETIQRELMFNARQTRNEERALRDVETGLLSAFRLSGLMEGLAKNLGRLGIPSCYLALYENERESRLALACRAEAGGTAMRRLPIDYAPFQTNRLLPDGLLPDRRHSFIVERLRFESSELGYVLFEMGPQDGAVYEDLGATLSSALQGALLLEQVQKRSVQLDAIVSRTLSTSEDMRATVLDTAKQAQAVSDAAGASMAVSKDGRKAVADTVSGMETVQRQVEAISSSIAILTERTRQIEEIIKALEDIVAQSDILAINASIQAARAGNAGKGFAVVAREIRSLAERSRTSTAKINAILTDIQKASESAVTTTMTGSEGARRGMSLAGKAGATIEHLESAIEDAARVTLEISASTHRQASAMDELVLEVKAIKEASSRTSTSFREAGIDD